MLRLFRHPAAPPTYAACYTGFEEVAAIAAVASTVVTVAASQQAARNQQKALDYQAQVAKQQGQEEMAAASYEGAQQRRQALIANERVNAVAAASGAGATDPSVLKDEGNIAGQGEYNSLMRLASGANKQSGYAAQAGLDIYEGQAARTAANWKSLGSIVGGASSFYSKYGAGIMPDSGNFSASGGGLDSSIAYGGGVVPGMS